MGASDYDRVMAKVDKAGPIPEERPELGACWEWTASLDRWGYGQVRFAGTTARAHRVVYVLHGGELLPGLELDHLCRRRSCVRPDHLEQVTRRDNQHRGDTLARANAAVTRCPAGHPYDEANTYHRPDRVGRHCRACKRERDREASRRRRAAR